jgi:methylmalonyl-CoA mutase N-terminal domain/subunit
VESRDEIVVGVNRFDVAEEEPTDILKIDAELERRQVAKLTKLKSTRDNDAVKRALARVSETAAGEANLMPAIVDAVRVYATLGEVSDAMRSRFGEFHPPVFV